MRSAGTSSSNMAKLRSVRAVELLDCPVADGNFIRDLVDAAAPQDLDLASCVHLGADCPGVAGEAVRP